MEKGKIHIDDIYKGAFSNYKMKTSSYHWNNIYKKITQKQFYKFSLNKFNIFYLSSIILTLIFSLSIFIDHFLLTKNEENPFKTEKVKFNIDTSIVKTIYIRDTIFYEIPVARQVNIIAPESNQLMAKKIETFIDTTKKNQNFYQDSVKLDEKQDNKKSLNIIYRTIEKKDTVIIYKNRGENENKKSSIFGRKKAD